MDRRSTRPLVPRPKRESSFFSGSRQNLSQTIPFAIDACVCPRVSPPLSPYSLLEYGPTHVPRSTKYRRNEATKQREKALSDYNQLLDEATSSILIDPTMGEIDFCPPYEFIISRTRPWLEAEEDLPQIAIVVTYSIHDSTKVSPRRCSCTTLLPARAAIMHPGTGVRIIRLRPSR